MGLLGSSLLLWLVVGSALGAFHGALAASAFGKSTSIGVLIGALTTPLGVMVAALVWLSERRQVGELALTGLSMTGSVVHHGAQTARGALDELVTQRPGQAVDDDPFAEPAGNPASPSFSFNSHEVPVPRTSTVPFDDPFIDPVVADPFEDGSETATAVSSRAWVVSPVAAAGSVPSIAVEALLTILGVIGALLVMASTQLEWFGFHLRWPARAVSIDQVVGPYRLPLVTELLVISALVVLVHVVLGVKWRQRWLLLVPSLVAALWLGMWGELLLIESHVEWYLLGDNVSSFTKWMVGYLEPIAQQIPANVSLRGLDIWTSIDTGSYLLIAGAVISLGWAVVSGARRCSSPSRSEDG